MNPINILLTGLIRKPELLIKSIEDFVGLRSKKLVDKIIFSTWIGDIDKYKGLRKTLTDFNCHLIESKQPPNAPGNIWHQMKALYLGLVDIENEAFVLKTRPDIYINKDYIDRLIKNISCLSIIFRRGTGNFLSKKIWIPYFEIFKPFYMSDECFLGQCSDLKKLVNFDSAYDVIYDVDCGITHIRRFIHPFISEIPILKLYLKHFAISGHFTPYRFDIVKSNLSTNLYLYILSIYYRILHRYFYIEGNCLPNQFTFYRPWFNSENLNKICNHHFFDNFKAECSWNPAGGHIYSFDSLWLDNLMNHNMKSDESLERLYTYMNLSFEDVPYHDFNINEDIEKINKYKEKVILWKEQIKKEQMKEYRKLYSLKKYFSDCFT